MATEKQIAANRANAARSTGPKTDEGKAASRRNALKHGLAGSGIVLTEGDEAAVVDRLAEWAPEFGRLVGPERRRLFELVRESVRIDRCTAEADATRERTASRAEDSWREDRRSEAESLGRTLTRAPNLTSALLATRRDGAAWMAERWSDLAEVIRTGGDWSDDQRVLALDLLGTPVHFRDIVSPLVPHGPDDPGSIRAHRLAMAEGECRHLREKAAGPLSEPDEADRRRALRGVQVAADRDLDRINRYRMTAQRRYDAALKALPDPVARDSRPVESPADETNPIPVAVEPTDDPQADLDVDPVLAHVGQVVE